MTDIDSSSETTVSRPKDEEWERRDAWLGVQLLLPALLQAAFLWSLFEQGVHGLLIVGGGFFSLLLAALGVNAIVRSLLASK